MSTESRFRRAVGVLEALATPHGVDRYVELISPAWSLAEVRGRVTAAVRGTTDSVTLTIRPNRNWTGFRAGQYVQATVEIDGVRHTRCYSMASSAHRADGQFELTVKAHPHGKVSQHLVAEARPGMVLGLSPAQGEFTLADERPQRILLISGGSGITPVMSMLRTLADEGHRGPVTFLHYALTAETMIYRDELTELAAAHPNVTAVRVFTEAPGTGDLDGFFSAAQLAAAEPHWADAETYVCGPAPLMDGVRAHYEAAGVADRLHHEAFTLLQFVAEAGAAEGAIRFGRSGIDVASDGTTLLEHAEAAGLDPESGCRMGICHTCVRQLTCGTVRNVVSGELTSDAGTDVQLCVNVAVGDVEIDL